MVSKKRVLVTSALPYVNNVPHLGNLIGAVLSADVFARFKRSSGEEVLFICGADEHGTTTETKALEEGLSSQELCDKYFEIHKGIYEWFSISFDIFGRTHDPTQVELTQMIFNDLYRNGFIVEDELEQTFCEHDNRFLADRFVEGTCPHCDYPDARGDQCDSCGKMLNPKELVNPRCKLCGNAPVIKRVRHLFLDLEKLQPRLEAFVEEKGSLWSENALRITKAWFKEGLTKRCITRDLQWGVPVPLSGWEDKVFYVWFDATIGYISITKQLLGDGYDEWWLRPDEVDLYQFMGKDNIPFHTLVFPASLLGSGRSWKTLDYMSSTEYLNYEDGKFSKSRHVGVFGDDAIRSGIPADVFRYYLITNRPETSDAVFTWQDFADKLNNELVATLGNLVNRTFVFISRFADGKVVEKPELNTVDKAFWEKVKVKESEVTRFLEQVRLKDALHAAMDVARLGNAYFQASAPWKAIKEDPVRAHASLFLLAHTARDLAVLLEPFLPVTSASVFAQLGREPQSWSSLGVLDLGGQEIAEPSHLFSKLEDDRVKELKEEFAGKKAVVADPFSAVDLRVAEVKVVRKHPDAEKLFVEEVDLGPLGRRQIVSGLVGHYEAEELVGKRIVVVANLKAAKLRGELSQGMLLAVEDDAGKVGLVVSNAAPGTPVLADGVASAPVKELEFKAFASLSLRADGEVTCDGRSLLAGGVPVGVDREVKGKVS